MGKSINLLIVEDQLSDVALMVQELKSSGYTPVFKQVKTAEEMHAALDKKGWDLVISDYQLSDFSALAALALLQKSGQDIPFIIVANPVGEAAAVSAIKAGAQDYIEKQNLRRLPTAIEQELRDARLRKSMKRVQQALEYIASYNPLTHLPNQNLYSEHLKRAIKKAKRDRKPVATIVLDVDRFRDINETLGHSCGNLLLQQLGSRLQETLRESDIVAHLGEDEFAVILIPGDPSGAVQVVHKLQQVLEQPFLVENIPIQVEMSAGIAIYPDHGGDSDDLFAKADLAMYLAKKIDSGYVIYTPENDHYSARHVALLRDLSSAIETNQLALYYQPKIDLKTQRTVGVEALVCWQHPEQGFLLPNRFVPAAERTGLINSLFFWTLHAALRQLALWEKAGVEMGVSLNLSARNLHDGLIVNKLTNQIDASGISPKRLKVEITEGAVMADSIRAKEFMSDLKQMGVGISIDDFGTSYTSLPYLQKLHIDELKVDKSFIIGMMDNKENEVMISSIVELGHHLGLSIVAEGIENQTTLDRLIELGYDMGQGYYFCNPLSVDDLTQWLYQSPYGLKGSS